MRHRSRIKTAFIGCTSTTVLPASGGCGASLTTSGGRDGRTAAHRWPAGRTVGSGRRRGGSGQRENEKESEREDRDLVQGGLLGGAGEVAGYAALARRFQGAADQVLGLRRRADERQVHLLAAPCAGGRG